MFGIGGVELAIILVFAFLLFGPDKLPQIIRNVTQILNQLKGLRDQANQVIKTEVVDPLKDIEQQVAPLTNNVSSVSDKIAQKIGLATGSVSETLKPATDALKTAANPVVAETGAAETSTTPTATVVSAATASPTAPATPTATVAPATPVPTPVKSSPKTDSSLKETEGFKVWKDDKNKESFAQRKARLEAEHSASPANSGEEQ